MENESALQLASRFSMPPNSLGYCGKETAGARFQDCIKTGNCANVEEELSKFIVLHPYLKMMGQVTGLSKFDYKIIEGYWLGNSILRQFKAKDYSLLLECFLEQGVPQNFVDDLRKNPPKKFIPTHLFQVLYVGVGKASGAVPFNLESINNCMIRWGEVSGVGEKEAEVELNTIDIVDNKYTLKLVKETIPIDRSITPDICIDATIITHWKQTIKVLTEKETKQIAYWTKKVIDIVPVM